MAADPNAVPRAPLSLGYQTSFEPLRLNPPIQLPETYHAWEGVGRSAMQLGDRLQNSPLFNPEVREQMKEGIARSKVGEAAMAHMMQKGNERWLYGATGETPQGAVITAPITQPVAQQVGEGINYGGSGQEEKKTLEQQKEPSTKTKELPSPTKEAQEPGTSQVSYPSNLYASSEPGIPAGYQGGGSSAAAPEGTPADLTFTNPATGNVEPKQQVAPSMFAGRTAPAPAAPIPAPPQQPVAQSQTPAAATQADQAAMAQWQAQNIHPVVAPPAVKQAMIDNVSTKFKNAEFTYQSSGGVKGEPSFGIDFKGGGHTTLSLSQLTSTPWGRNLIMGQNAMQAVGSQQPPETNQLAPSAPSAPSTPMPSGTGAGAPQGAPAPPAPGTYNAAAYQMPQGPTLTQAGEINPALMAGGTNKQAAEATQLPTEDVETSPEQVAKMNADTGHAAFNWKTDEKGNSYIAGPQDPNRLFWTQRFYPLQGGFKSGPWTLENQQKQELLDAYGGVQGPPTDKILTKDDIDQLTPQERADKLNRARWWANTAPIPNDSAYYQKMLTEQEISKNIQKVLDIDEATHKAGKPTSVYSTTEEGYSGHVAARNTLLGIDTDKPNLQPPDIPIGSIRDGPHGAEIFTDFGRWVNVEAGALHGALAGGHQYINPVADDMESARKSLVGWMDVLHGTAYPSMAQPGAAAAINIHGSAGEGGLSAGASHRIELPGSDPTGLMEVNRLLQGGDRAVARENLIQRKKAVDDLLQQDILNAPLSKLRIPDNMRDNNRALLKNQPLPDNTNLYRDGDNVRIPPHYKRPFGEEGEAVSGQAETTPEMKTADDVTKFMKTAEPDKPFLYDSGDGKGKQLYWTPKKKETQ